MSLDELLTRHQEYERIQLKRMPSGHLQMQVSLNGVPGNFILDTGAGATILEEKRKSAFRLESRLSDKKFTGTGGSATGMQLSTGNRMKIGPLEIDDSSIYLVSLSHVNEAFQSMKLEEVDGIIGADILSAHRGVIDYSNLVLYLRK
ncbi:retropepsin-like aspartic protease [Pontibacter russatus]|uniref:retropepsin-like aspartic protease n=1 Tax=Pontibacter russatus TaxID=2694929 RepID=UPI0013799852|nr:retropepsin-like aspartic protease [Pontibacter russatus]